MNRTPHAFDFFADPPAELPSVCVVHGSELFLKQLVLRQITTHLSQDADEAPISELEAQHLEWRDVHDELATRSLFGPSRRVVLLRQADKFVTQHRPKLEAYVEQPLSSALLIIDVNSWMGNTRLAKRVAVSGLAIACKPPTKQNSRSKAIDTKAIANWVTARAKQQHGIKLSAAATEQLLDLAGTELGIVDQELAKISLVVDDPQATVTPEMVIDIVGGWKTKTTWDLLDATCDGNAAEALLQLDRLLTTGEHPLALFGAFSWSLRRFAAATRSIEQSERDGKRPQLSTALKEAGFRDYPPGALRNAERQLRQLGRIRAGKLYDQLLEMDLQLKGSHASPHRARGAMERLIVGLSKNADPRLAQ